MEAPAVATEEMINLIMEDAETLTEAYHALTVELAQGRTNVNPFLIAQARIIAKTIYSAAVTNSWPIQDCIDIGKQALESAFAELADIIENQAKVAV